MPTMLFSYKEQKTKSRCHPSNLALTVLTFFYGLCTEKLVERKAAGSPGLQGEVPCLQDLHERKQAWGKNPCLEEKPNLRRTFCILNSSSIKCQEAPGTTS